MEARDLGFRNLTYVYKGLTGLLGVVVVEVNFQADCTF